MAEKEKIDKTKLSKSFPKDAQVVMSILNELNMPDHEKSIVNQTLEFSFRYVTCILEEAKVLANHSRKKVIDLDDVKMSLEEVLDKNFTQPPPRNVLAKIAEVRNSMPLNPIKPHCGLRLPPDRYCLTAANFKLRAANPARKMTKSALEGRSNLKTQMKAGNATQAKRQTVVPVKSQVVTIPKPIIKFATAPKTITIDTKPLTNQDNAIKMESDADSGIKQTPEDMDFEAVP